MKYSNEIELKVMFGKEKADAYLKFQKLLDNIKIKYSDYLKEKKPLSQKVCKLKKLLL